MATDATTAAPTPLVRVEARHETPSMNVARELLKYLLSGNVKLGSRLPSERQLAEQFGIGRSLVREALKSLELLGLVESRTGAGTFLVGTASRLLPQVIEWSVLLGERSERELIEARTFLEVSLAELAATHRTEDDVAEIERCLNGMRASVGDLDRYVEYDLAFHSAIARASHNDVMADMHGSVRSLLQDWARRVIHGFGRADFSIEVHEPIAVAIRAADPKAARTAMEQHMTNALKHLDDVTRK
ncbi:FadR/GntR family transcriptional regulator [Brachybacterium vulturis]|nr:FadR/GntR family transcriptional regulator [Brachybacterium vulturis]